MKESTNVQMMTLRNPFQKNGTKLTLKYSYLNVLSLLRGSCCNLLICWVFYICNLIINNHLVYSVSVTNVLTGWLQFDLIWYLHLISILSKGQWRHLISFLSKGQWRHLISILSKGQWRHLISILSKGQWRHLISVLSKGQWRHLRKAYFVCEYLVTCYQ